MWRVEDMRAGDYVSVRIVNKRGDHNLDGGILRGIIKDMVVEHRMVRLESGWCCHEKDDLLEHREAGKE
jgi:hypothetical protein